MEGFGYLGKVRKFQQQFRYFLSYVKKTTRGVKIDPPNHPAGIGLSYIQ